MQDFVRIGVADAGEQPRAGQRALERVVLGREARSELRRCAGQRLEATGVECRERCLALDNMQRRAALAAGLRQDDRTVIEIEHRQRAARRLAVRRPPVQATGDHQMDHEEQRLVGIELDDHPLAEPADADDLATGQRRDRRDGGAQHESARQAQSTQRGAADLRGQTLDVHRDIGQFRHDSPIRKTKPGARPGFVEPLVCLKPSGTRS